MSSPDVSSVTDDIHRLHLSEQPTGPEELDLLIDVGSIPPSLESISGHTVFGFYLKEADVFDCTWRLTKSNIYFDRQFVLMRAIHGISRNTRIQYDIGRVTEEMKAKMPWIDEEVGKTCWLVGLTRKQDLKRRPRRSQIDRIRPLFRHDACWWPSST